MQLRRVLHQLLHPVADEVRALQVLIAELAEADRVLRATISKFLNRLKTLDCFENILLDSLIQFRYTDIGTGRRERTCFSSVGPRDSWFFFYAFFIE